LIFVLSNEKIGLLNCRVEVLVKNIYDFS
jgi:hypothetical protein